jgi:hypothetical protein
MLAKKVRLETYQTCFSVDPTCGHVKVENNPKHNVVSFKSAYLASGVLFLCHFVCRFAGTKSICLEVHATTNVPHQPTFVRFKSL